MYEHTNRVSISMKKIPVFVIYGVIIKFINSNKTEPALLLHIYVHFCNQLGVIPRCIVDVPDNILHKIIDGYVYWQNFGIHYITCQATKCAYITCIELHLNNGHVIGESAG